MVISNTAPQGAGICNNVSSLTLVGTTVSTNAIATGGYDGAGIYNISGSLTLNDSVVRDNGEARNGGGIFTNGGTVTLTDSTISGNNVTQFGGGVFTQVSNTIFTNSTLSNNTADYGAGVFIYGGTTDLTNSTVGRNRALGHGGGIYVDNNPGNDKDVHLNNVTLATTRSNSDGTGGENGGGIYIESGYSATVYFKNSILAGNHRGFIFPSDDDCIGTIHSLDYNLIEETSGCTISGTTTHNQTGLSAQLNTLQDNGGPTLTHFPQEGSPVIDKGNPAGCKDTVGATLVADQRGFARHVDGDTNGSAYCDVGAVEYALNPTPILTSLSLSSAQEGGAAFTLTVNGSDFVDGALVGWNGSDRPTTFVSSSQVTAQISAADIATKGSATVTVANPPPGGGTSNALTFTISEAPQPNPVPTLTSLSPSSTQAGGGAFTLTVNGNDFANGAVVGWNGTDRTTTFVSSTQVTALISAADIASAGSASVTVTNPPPGGGTSSVLTFTISASPTSAPTIYLPLVKR